MLLRLVMTVLLGAGLATGCGFHLRGTFVVPEALSTVYVEGSDVDIVRQLKDSLASSGAQVLSERTEDAAVVQLLRSDYARQVRTVDTRGLATSYELVYTVAYRVLDGNGETLAQVPAFELRRDFNFDSSQLLQKRNEEQFLREDMQEEIVQRILRRLSTVTTAQLPGPREGVGPVPVRA